ncbi:MAG: hypothetical protein CM15mP58_14420 [Burkholderiaceae bacterium]|nr:MAG: hypothetical protein CM15mP58_14420 [Burkholderiaceae bacterium]
MSSNIKKRKKGLFFWLTFCFFFLLYLIFYGSLAYEFGFVYIWGVGLVASFFFAWFLSIIAFVLKNGSSKRG